MLFRRPITLAAFGALLCAAFLLFAAFATPEAGASHFDRLLAPKSKCEGQTRLAAPTKRKVRAMRCMHAHARQKVGSPRLKKSRKLQSSARSKAQDIFRCADFGHEACGRDAFYWLRRVGFANGCFGAGENLTMASGALRKVRSRMSAWLHSTAHRTALLRPTYRRFGIATVAGSMGGYRVEAWVAHFATAC